MNPTGRDLCNKTLFPYMGCSMLLVALLILFPQLALWLPGM
ncbi:hypothetical protein [Sulfitobacter sp.]